MKYKVNLSTIASITIEVDTEDEETAIEQAYDIAHDAGNQVYAGQNWTIGLNDEWQYDEPTVEPA